MLLRCCLIHISIIILRHFLYLLYLGLGLFMSYLCDLLFIFIFIFIMINCTISWIQTHFFCLFFFCLCRIALLCLITFGWWRWLIFFGQFQPGVAYKSVKRACITIIFRNFPKGHSHVRNSFSKIFALFTWFLTFSCWHLQEKALIQVRCWAELAPGSPSPHSLAAGSVLPGYLKCKVQKIYSKLLQI